MAKLVKCKTCGQMIAKTANRCPHCGAQQHTVALSICAVIIVLTVVLCVMVIGSSGGSSPAAATERPAATEAPQAEEQLIYSAYGVEVYYRKTEGAPYPAKGKYIWLRIVNDSAEEITVQARDVSMNGVMVDYICSVDVMAGKSAIDKVWVYNLDEKGIEEFSSAELKLIVYNPGLDVIGESGIIHVE